MEFCDSLGIVLKAMDAEMTRRARSKENWFGASRLLGLLLSALLAGCGTTRLQRATQQMVLSDAVDRAVSQLDFSSLKDRKVYLDTTYIRQIKGIDFVNAPYIISSLRHRLTSSGALLTDNKGEADVVVEPRVGALGYDGHDVTYGIPPSRLLSTASVLVPNAPQLPPIPEISVAKRSDEVGVAKINVFAYERATGEPLRGWKTAMAKSSARSTWVFGAGPFQSGSIYSNPMFVGQEIHIPRLAAPRLPTPSGIARLISHDEESDEESEADHEHESDSPADDAVADDQTPPDGESDSAKQGAEKDASQKASSASPPAKSAASSTANPEKPAPADSASKKQGQEQKEKQP